MAILMTGFTGILGSVIGPELHDVYFLVRSGMDNRRLPKGINPDKIIEGDITKPMCGVSLEDLVRMKNAGITRFLHLAANVSFAITDVGGEIWRDNYVGTQNAIVLAQELGIQEFLHCSTAFADDQRNPYEISKKAAEGLVIRSGMKYSIFRPSAMVGDSQTGYTADFNGYYGVYVYFHMIAEKARGENKELVVPIPVYVVCSDKTTINLIPLDWVRYTLLALLKKPATNQTFHLAHNNPPNARWVMEKGFEILKVNGVKCVNEPLTKERKEELHNGNRMSGFIQKRIDLILNQYIPYVTFERKFSLRTTMEALGADFREPPPITAELLSRLLNYAVEKNFGHTKAEKKRGNGASKRNADLQLAIV